VAFADQAEFLGRVLLGRGGADAAGRGGDAAAHGLALPVLGDLGGWWGWCWRRGFARNLLRKAGLDVVALVATADAEDPRLEGARRRLVVLNVVHIGILV